MNKYVRKCVLSVLAVAALFVARPAISEDAQSVDLSAHPWIGKAAPEFALRKVAGGELKLEDLKGKYVVIHFGASW